MIASPYAFLRGAANVHAADFAGLPATGITPVVCGDAHLGNFGFYASPERDLVFDLNDFDEAHPGAWEWDLRRLTTSVWVAGRENGASDAACGEAVGRCVEEYRLQIAALAEQPLLARSYEYLDVHGMLRTAPGTSLRAEIQTSARRARKRTSDPALPPIREEGPGGPPAGPESAGGPGRPPGPRGGAGGRGGPCPTRRCSPARSRPRRSSWPRRWLPT